jgi:hypothetical protein
MERPLSPGCDDDPSWSARPGGGQTARVSGGRDPLQPGYAWCFQMVRLNSVVLRPDVETGAAMVRADFGSL